MRIGVGKSNQDLEFYVVEKAIAHHGHEAKHSYNDIALLKVSYMSKIMCHFTFISHQ